MTPERQNKLTKTVLGRQKNLIVVLEDITDPHNAAAVLRTCESFGIQQVHYVFENVEPYDPYGIGKLSSSAANKWLDLTVHREGSEKAFADIKNSDFELWVTALDETAESIYDTEFTGTDRKLAIVFGNEHAGVTEIALRHADHKLYIPMRGITQSLNISVTAAITIFEVTRQRIPNMNDYLLAEDEQQALSVDFAQR